MKKIPAKLKDKTYWAVVDDEDYIYLSKYKWHYERGYARRSEYQGGGRSNPKIKHIRMHQDLLSCPEDMHTDHINRNKLDNRKENLRIVTRSQNFANRELYSSNKSGFKGVSYLKQNKKWQAEIQCNKVQYYLGSFDTPQEAAKVYDNKARELFGDFAKLNFY